jgi:hypothetical protein
MTAYPFELTEDVNLIIVLASVDGFDLRLALDTGASNTIIDLTALLIAGYRKADVVDIVEIETGKGIIQADVYKTQALKTLGISQANFIICSYDFLANSVLTDIDGVLGIDFFRSRKLCIDFDRREITVSRTSD